MFIRSTWPLMTVALIWGISGCGQTVEETLQDPEDELGADGKTDSNAKWALVKDDAQAMMVEKRGVIAVGQLIAGQRFGDAKLGHLYTIPGYTFAGTKGQRVNIALWGDPLGDKADTILYLYGPKRVGALRQQLAKVDDSFRTSDSVLQGFELPEDGVDYLIVAAGKGVPASAEEDNPCRNKPFWLELQCSGIACPGREVAVGIQVQVARPSLALESETLQRVKDYFQTLGYNVTVEESPPLDTSSFSESEVQELEEDGLYTGKTSSSRLLKKIYKESFTHRGEVGWHYVLLVDRTREGNRGWGLSGGDIVVLAKDLINGVPAEKRADDELQLFLHELGHNLTLAHGTSSAPALSDGPPHDGRCAMEAINTVQTTHYCPICADRIRSVGSAVFAP